MLFVVAFSLSIYLPALTLACEPGNFRLKSMDECHLWLTCEDLTNIRIVSILGTGSTKLVYGAEWNGTHEVAWNQLGKSDLSEDFHAGLGMLIALNPSPFVVQLVGFCRERNIYLTEVHRGDASVLGSILKNGSIETRCLDACINYAEILHYLHSSPAGVRVMCDSNTLKKTLEQFLITDEGRIVVNDIDALPEVNKKEGKGIKCGRRELTGSFVAPEQLWPHGGVPFDDDLMPSYDEKTDIWKMADVCEYLLSFCDEGRQLFLKHVQDTHKECKRRDPQGRPQAGDVVQEYRRIKTFLEALLYREL